MKLDNADLDWRVNCWALVACDRPVHQVLIKVFTLKVFDGFLACFPGIIRLVVRVVQLGSQPHVFSADFALFQDASQGFADHVLVAIVRSTVDMPAFMHASHRDCGATYVGTWRAHF